MDFLPRPAAGAVFGLATAMRAEGLEPPRAEAHQDLNLARIPIPPRPRDAPKGLTRGQLAASRSDSMILGCL
jgi:hypothetical protein